MLEEVQKSGMSNNEFRIRYGVGVTWLSDIRAGRTKAPSVDTVQRIYEDLTGNSLLK